jgi:hypothetical protein
MGYDVTQIKHRKMNNFKMLTNANDILEMREAIENNEQHRGKAFDIAYKGYSEIHKHNNLQMPKYRDSCSGCIHRINTMLKNWLFNYDKIGGPSKQAKKVDVKQAIKSKRNVLTPIADRRKALEDVGYNEIKQSAIDAGVYEECKKLNGGKLPKKTQLIDKLLLI